MNSQLHASEKHSYAGEHYTISALTRINQPGLFWLWSKLIFQSFSVFAITYLYLKGATAAILTFGVCLALSISTLEASCLWTAIALGGDLCGTSGLRSSGVHISSSEKLLEALFCRDTLSLWTLRRPVSTLVAAGPGLKLLLLNLNEGIPVLL